MPIFITMVDEMRRLRVLIIQLDKDLQTLTILLLTIHGLLRIMEVLNLSWKDVKEEFIWSEDSQYIGSRREIITLTLWDTKTSGSKEGLPEYVVVCDRRGNQPDKYGNEWDPVRMLKAWRARCERKDGTAGEKRVFTLSKDEYSQRLKQALRDIGVDDTKYGTHSGRIGGATMLWEAGASDSEIMELGRWKSDCWKIYCRQVKSKCLKLSAMVNNSRLTRGALVGQDLDLSIEIDRDGE